jgi:hypothetical protein
MGSIYQAFLFFILFNAIDDRPVPRHLEEITYDKSGNKLLLFGGIQMAKGGWTEPDMVYEWDGNNWHSKEVKGPVGRRGHVWVHDDDNSETYLMGGVTTGHIIKDSILFDVWAWDGDKWRQMNSTCPVKEPEGVYDQVNKRILVYGDANNKDQPNYNLPAAFELWEYKNNTWKKISIDGPNITGSRMISFDTERKRLVIPIFEENRMITWEWTGNEWVKTIFEKDCPSYRTKFALAYDPVGKVTVLFGGLSGDRVQLGDFWSWDGKQWKQIESVNTPSARNSAHFAAGNGELFLYGGSVPKATQPGSLELSNELWRWKNDLWEKIK